MKSMTGYGYGVSKNEFLEFKVEISSLNRKSLEISMDLGKDFQYLESTLSTIIKNSISRGRILIKASIQKLQLAENMYYKNSKDSFFELLNYFKELAQESNIIYTPDLNFLLNVFKLHQSQLQSNITVEKNDHNLLIEAFNKALETFETMRQQEGHCLKKDILEQINLLKNNISNIQKQAPFSIERYRTALMERLQQANLDINLQDERILKELALFAERCDIREEIVRLLSHLDSFENTISQPFPMGRKLDFLCQEIGRECNTLGAKANNIDISTLAIDSKLYLEKIREQVQNIE